MTTDGISSLMAQQFSPVPNESIVFKVAQSLLDYLTSGSIPPGTRLPSERKLAESLNVGRSAVREALASLDLLGIVSIRPGSGTYLRESSSALLPRAINWGLMLGQPRVNDLVEIRQFLEIMSAPLAADRATDEDVQALSDLVEAMKHAVPDPAAFVEFDVAFHLAVARAAKNSVLTDVLNSVRSLLHVWIERTSNDESVTSAAFAEHVAIFEAIRDHDADAAQEAMRAHMAIASGRLRQSLDDHESRTAGTESAAPTS